MKRIIQGTVTLVNNGNVVDTVTKRYTRGSKIRTLFREAINHFVSEGTMPFESELVEGREYELKLVVELVHDDEFPEDPETTIDHD